MTKASSLPRRSLAGLAGLLLPAMTGAAVFPRADAVLLHLCSAFHKAHNASCRAKDDSWETHHDRRWEISDAIEDMAPTTNAGRMANAHVALVLMEEMADPGNANERFTLIALRELVGSAAA